MVDDDEEVHTVTRLALRNFDFQGQELEHLSAYSAKEGPATEGMQGEAIPIVGRITALIDVFDVLGSKRSYKGAWTEDLAMEHIRAGSGTQIDPA